MNYIKEKHAISTQLNAKLPHVVDLTSHTHIDCGLVVDTTSHMAGLSHATKLPCVIDPTTHMHSDGGLVVGALSQVAGHNHASKPKPARVVHNSTQYPIGGSQPTHNQRLVISKSFQVALIQLSPKLGWEDKVFGKKQDEKFAKPFRHVTAILKLKWPQTPRILTKGLRSIRS